MLVVILTLEMLILAFPNLTGGSIWFFASTTTMFSRSQQTIAITVDSLTAQVLDPTLLVGLNQTIVIALPCKLFVVAANTPFLVTSSK